MTYLQRFLISLAVGILILEGSAFQAAGQEYLFRVPQTKMLVTVNPDASVRITYEFIFQNTPSGHAIDIVDIGTPHAGYKLNKVRAWIDGYELRNIRVSTFVKPGFEVHLDAGTIGPGKSGQLRVEFTMPDMVFSDTTRSDYASLRITPTWFGEQYVVGTTELQVAIQLPKSVQPDEVLHQGLNFTLKATTESGPLVGWEFPAVRLTGRNNVAVSFPKRDLQRVVHVGPIDLLLKWFSESQEARITLGVVFLILLGLLFFRFSGGTGFSVFVVLAVGTGVAFYLSPGLHLLAMPVVVVLIGLNEWLLGRRKLRYMPPIAQAEGGGIKRGLTAPEAAVLLELPVAKALSLVIFGMLKKGILRQVEADPLKVAVDEAFQWKSDLPTADQPRQAVFCREAAVKRGIVVHNYELPFIFLLQQNPDKPVRELNFGVPMKQLIEATAARMKGFDLSETKDYYRAIIRRAMEQAAAIGDISQREQTIDRNFDWILMDDGYPTVFDRGPYRPVWTRGSTVLPPAGPSSAPNIPGTTTFGDVASSFSGWAENTMGSFASAVSPDALNLPHPSGGFLNLSGVDHVAGEFFRALSEASTSGGGGGGGGGGCACACAGCACACACAGGGR
jgi:hypothetical protein